MLLLLGYGCLLFLFFLFSEFTESYFSLLIAWDTQAQRIISSILMWTVISQRCSPVSMVTMIAHSFGIIGTVCMSALVDLPLSSFLLLSWFFLRSMGTLNNLFFRGFLFSFVFDNGCLHLLLLSKLSEAASLVVLWQCFTAKVDHDHPIVIYVLLDLCFHGKVNIARGCLDEIHESTPSDCIWLCHIDYSFYLWLVSFGLLDLMIHKVQKLFLFLNLLVLDFPLMAIQYLLWVDWEIEVRC